MRKLKRQIARHAMEQKGIHHVNHKRVSRRGKVLPSYFALHWKDYFVKAVKE